MILWTCLHLTSYKEKPKMIISTNIFSVLCLSCSTEFRCGLPIIALCFFQILHQITMAKMFQPVIWFPDFSTCSCPPALGYNKGCVWFLDSLMGRCLNLCTSIHHPPLKTVNHDAKKGSFDYHSVNQIF